MKPSHLRALSKHKFKLRPTPASHPLLLAAKPMLVKSSSIPNAVDLAALWFPGIQDQGQEGACTGFATAQWEEIAWGAANGKKIGARRSPAYLYARTRMAEGSFPNDSGATMADEFAVLNTFGVCSQDDMPYDQDPAEPIPNVGDADAAAFRCNTPCTVDMSNADAFKSVLAAGMPIGIAIPVYQSFEGVGSDGILPVPDPDKEALLGGHGVLLAGYKVINGQLYRRGINQWGTGWGDGGYFWMPDGYPIWEAWTAPLVTPTP